MATTEQTSGLGIVYDWTDGEGGWGAGMNANLKAIALFGVQLSVIDKDLSAPPVSPTTGDRYIVASGASGAWAGHSGKIAVWNGSAWELKAPKAGWLCFVYDEEKIYVFTTAWTAIVSGGSGSGELDGLLTAKGGIISHNGTDPTVVAAPETAGLVPTSNPSAACGWDWQTPSEGGGGGTQTLYEKDLSTLATTSKFSNGAGTLDGANIVAENMANATQFNIVNGSGLVMQANTTSSRLSDRSSPLITIPLTEYSEDLVQQKVKDILSWFMITNNQASPADSSFFGYETNPYNVSAVTRVGLIKGVYGADPGTPGFVVEGVENSVRTTVSDPSNPSHDVILLRWINMFYSEVYSGASASGVWPALNSMQFRGYLRSPLAAATAAFAANLNNRKIGLILSSYSFNTNGTFITTLKKIRIQANF